MCKTSSFQRAWDVLDVTGGWAGQGAVWERERECIRWDGIGHVQWHWISFKGQSEPTGIFKEARYLLCFKILYSLCWVENRWEGNERKCETGCFSVILNERLYESVTFITAYRGKDECETWFRSRKPRTGWGVDLYILHNRMQLWYFFLKVRRLGVVGVEVQ